MATVYKYPQWLMPENSNQSKVSNYSFDFDGVDDYVDCGQISALENTSTFTLSGWFKQTTLDQQRFMFSTYISSSNMISCETWSDGNMYFEVRNGALTYGYFDYSTVVTAGTWFHCACVFNGLGATDADKLKVYINGAEVTLSYNGTLPTTTNATQGNFRIGDNDGWNKEWLGSIDEVAIFSTNLSSSDISSIYNSGIPTTLPVTPVAHWKLGEQSTFTDNWLVNNSVLDNYSTRSFSFDGVDDYVNCGSSITNLQTGDISFSTWIYPTSFSSYNYFLDSGSITTKKGVFAGLEITTGFVAVLRKTGVTNTRCSTGWVDCGLTINNWYNIVGVYDEDGGTAGVGQLKLYVNGVLKATVDGSGHDTGTGYDLYIGKSENNFSHFIGNIDEVSFYDYPLTSGNVTTIYNSGSPASLTSLSPTSWWRMGEDATFSTNWSLPDNGSGSNTGTSANMDLADLEGNAPNYTGGGLSANMTIEDRVGNAPNSNNNALSYNMTESDRETDVPS